MKKGSGWGWHGMIHASGDAELGVCPAADHVRGDARGHPGARAGAPGGGEGAMEMKEGRR